MPQRAILRHCGAIAESNQRAHATPVHMAITIKKETRQSTILPRWQSV
jgi:hypothetical protein